jgi:hypothetical protein
LALAFVAKLGKLLQDVMLMTVVQTATAFRKLNMATCSHKRALAANMIMFSYDLDKFNSLINKNELM